MYKNQLKTTLFVILLIFFFACEKTKTNKPKKQTNPYVLVLGTAQDAGYPQAGCEKKCCQQVYKNTKNARLVSSIALVDPITNHYWIFDATPDFPKQLKLASNHVKNATTVLPKGIFLTHAHIGHYTGLMHLGREAMGAKNVPVYAMPKMATYLTNNGPWSQLVSLKNIALKALENEHTVVLNKRISVTPILVPHRDEFSETVGFVINVLDKKLLFVPDIDKWHKWHKDIVAYIKQVDVALLDATFYKDGEIKGRAMSEIPHPFATESMALFKNLSVSDKKKVYFTHFNHTNPLLIEGSEAQKTVLKNGFNIAKQAMIIAF